MKRRAMVKTPLIFHQSQFCHMGFACEFFLIILNPCCIFSSKVYLHEKTCNAENSLNTLSITILQHGFCSRSFFGHFEPMLYFSSGPLHEKSALHEKMCTDENFVRLPC
jgi:hypothetical protein